MNPEEYTNSEESLDPPDQYEWEALRKLGHQMVDDILTYLETVRDRPLWQPIPDDIKTTLTQQPLPEKPQDREQVYREFKDNILPYPMGNIHPRFWGWVMGTGTPFAALADMLAAGFNPNMGGGTHAGNMIEEQVLTWCKEMLVYPETASGLLTSGGSMANLIGMTVARNAKAEFDIRKHGVYGSSKRMRVYASAEVHSCVHRAMEVLGLGEDSLRLIPVNDNYEMDITALEEAIAQDWREGEHPFCVVGTAGTVNTGAFDDLTAIANICRRNKMWFHVDGAFGALAALPPEARHLVAGMERADSVAFDLHKWGYMPFEVGAILVKSEPTHYRAFTVTPDYLTHTARGIGAGEKWFSDYGVQLSRGFRALKVWMSIKEHGIDKFRRIIWQNIQQARYLAGLVEASPQLELLAPVPLNIVCFRFVADGQDDEALNALNQELLLRMQERGIAAPSYTTLNGIYTLRAAITNHRSRREDFDLLVRATIRIGKEILAEGA